MLHAQTIVTGPQVGLTCCSRFNRRATGLGNMDKLQPIVLVATNLNSRSIQRCVVRRLARFFRCEIFAIETDVVVDDWLAR